MLADEAPSGRHTAPRWLALVTAAMSGMIVAGMGGYVAQREDAVRTATTVAEHTERIAKLEQALQARAQLDSTMGERMARIEATLVEVRELLRRGH